MKSILVVVALIIAIFLADHFKLLQPRANYPEKINQLITTIVSSKPQQEGTVDIKPAETKKLYQWKSEDGVWKISDQRPTQQVYDTITLQSDSRASTNNVDSEPLTPLTNQELKHASQCKFYLEQIEQYKSKMRFGGSGHIVDHWQRQIKWYQKLALQSCGE